MKYLFLKGGILLVGLMATGLTILIRVDYSWQKEWLLDTDIIYDTDIYGDLYQLNLIENYRIPVEPRIDQYQFSEDHPTVEEADLFIFGDSFLDHPRQKGIPELIRDSVGLNVFYESHYLSPLYMVNLLGVKKASNRVIIMQVVERYLSTIDITLPKSEEEKSNVEQNPEESDFLRKTSEFFSSITGFIFPATADKNYEFIFKRGRYVNRISAWINTIQFNYLGYINKLTPVYSKDPPFLFYHETVDDSKYSYFHFHSDDEIKQIADNVEFIQKYLLDNYNLEFVLFPVPNKITIYHDLVTTVPYDDFLPRLYAELEKRNIPVIKIFEDFKSAEGIIYYPTDTHWNTHGMNIGYNKTMEKLTEMQVIEKDPSIF